MVKSADRVIQILEFIGSNKGGVTHGEIATALHIPKSSLSALLSNLVRREYLSFEKLIKRYFIGPQILTLAGRYLSNFDLVKIAQPFVRDLMLRTEESTEFAVQRGQDIQIVCKEDCSCPIKRVIELGERSPIHITAAGKAILAFLPEEEIDQYLSTVELSPVTKNTITDPDVLRKELTEIRSGVIAYSWEERIDGIIGMAAPVFNMQGNIIGSMVVPIPTFRFSPEKEREVEDVLRELSSKLSHQFGYGPDNKI